MQAFSRGSLQKSFLFVKIRAEIALFPSERACRVLREPTLRKSITEPRGKLSSLTGMSSCMVDLSSFFRNAIPTSRKDRTVILYSIRVRNDIIFGEVGDFLGGSFREAAL